MDNKLKTVSIKGKDYVMVNERIIEFRTNEKYKGFSLISEIIKLDDEEVVVMAKILDNNNNLVATGLARELQASSFINKTSYVENCETSAWGRALGNLGIGIDTSIATFEEVENAIKQQESLITSFQIKELKNYNTNIEELVKFYKKKDISEITFLEANQAIKAKQKEALKNGKLPEIEVNGE